MRSSTAHPPLVPPYVPCVTTADARAQSPTQANDLSGRYKAWFQLQFSKFWEERLASEAFCFPIKKKKKNHIESWQ